ncbi:MAG: hypothetical protein NTZ16_10190 [Verrucomicrobia bacterium]|nr:hypothetical protein [Verrucomicrobiota bacterium]
MARWHSCNILQVGAARRVWQFDARKADCPLNREQAVAAGQPLPENLVAKSWTTLWQPKLNVAWLAAEHVFLRVVHLPQADLAETRAMVEFHTQMAWSIHVLPAPETKPAAPVLPRQSEATAGEGEKPKEALQTIIVVMVARNLVEEFLGTLEKDGFLADRLEVPLIDQLQNAAASGEGLSRRSAAEADAWIYLADEKTGALVAWWFGGALQSLGFINLPADKNATDLLREQLTQMTWAGELEGWLRGVPQWHIVTAGDRSAEWQAQFAAALDAPVKLVPAAAAGQLAAATARRVTQAGDDANLLPPEYSARYHQQFVDRLWMRGLFAALGVFFMFALIFLSAVKFVGHQAAGVEEQVAERGGSYTNAIQLKARYQILKDRQDLKYAALNCWQTTARLLPEGATLNGLDFRDGKKLTLTGTAGSDQATAITEFNTAIRKAEVNGQHLFGKVESLTYNQNPANNTVTWSFSCEVSRAEEAP